MAILLTASKSSDYQRKGWGELYLVGQNQIVHNDVVNLSKKLIDEINIILQRQDSLEDAQKFPVENLKSAARSIIRYSSSGRAFAKIIAKDFIEKKLSQECWYISQPYIIFHFPNDLTELGPLHTDWLPFCGEMLTSWTPINKTQLGYAALTLCESTHSKTISTLFKVLNTLRSFKLFRDVIQDNFCFWLFGIKRIDLIPGKDKSVYWDANLLHKGNLNIENESHLAMVFRISEKPMWSEPACTLEDLAEDRTKPDDIPRLNDLLLEFQKAKKLAENAPNFHRFDTKYQNWVRKIVDGKSMFNQKTLKHTAFGLTMIGHANPKLNQSIAFYLISYFLAKENTSGFKRAMEMLSIIDRGKVVRFLADIGCSYDYQDKMLFRMLKILAGKSGLILKARNTVRTW
jgi:hypothetical protein